MGESVALAVRVAETSCDTLGFVFEVLRDNVRVLVPILLALCGDSDAERETDDCCETVPEEVTVLV